MAGYIAEVAASHGHVTSMHHIFPAVTGAAEAVGAACKRGPPFAFSDSLEQLLAFRPLCGLLRCGPPGTTSMQSHFRCMVLWHKAVCTHTSSWPALMVEAGRSPGATRMGGRMVAWGAGCMVGCGMPGADATCCPPFPNLAGHNKNLLTFLALPQAPLRV